MNDRNQRGMDTTARIEESNDRKAADGFLPQQRMDDLRGRWEDIQVTFVDDPRGSVQKAHGLVRSLVDDLTSTFTRERDNLEGQWSGGEVDTEDLRVALQRYRSFFNRLLST